MKRFYLFYFILFFAFSLQSQTHISRQWDVQSGNPVLLQWSNSAATPHVSGTVALLMGYLNDPTPSYDNLSPEDCERIIELSAKDLGPVDYDSLNGWSRLNAGEALRLVEKPFRKVQHYGTTSASSDKSVESIENQLSIYLKEPVQNESATWFYSGNYVVNAYKIKVTVNHNLPQNDSIMYYWTRPSMSTVFKSNKNNTLLKWKKLLKK